MIYGYIRVSSDKQTVENQRFEINNFCERENLKIDGWIEETISGTKSYYYCPIKILQSHKIRADFICEVSPFSLDFSRQTIKSNYGQKYTF